MPIKPLSFGAHILPRDYLASWDAQEQRNHEMLSHVLNLRDTIVFVGAGCSIPLGYPSWKSLSTGKAITTAQETIEASGQGDLKSRCESRLKELQKRINQPRADLRSADLTSILGTCEKVCKQCGCASDFRRQIAELFKHREGTKPNPNPYELLANLPVHRFVTSNYDCELEAALVKKRRLREEDYLKHSGKQSFAQTPKYDEQLAIFSIAFASGYEPRVFHCHGWHCDTDSMVLTEDDYQEWYFRDQAIHSRYRQTIDLIFNSNPMLFVGFSLSDDDLLTPLRFLSALEGEKKHSRPLFALLERSKDNNESRFEQLYDRYGIHVLPYEVEDNSEPGRTIALCREIGEIVERCRIHRKEWLDRPRKRSVESAPGKGSNGAPAFLQYDFCDSRELPPSDKKQDRCWLTLGRTTPLVWIVGSGGMGMSWEAIQQLKKLRTSTTKPGFSGFFFWNFRYCNDAITGIQRALQFMRGEPPPSEHPLDLLDELVDQLRKKRYFVILDGIERFLHQNVNNRTVVAVDSSYRRFFTALADTTKPLNSVLVLASRILPSVFEASANNQQEDKAATAITIEQAQGFSFEQIKSMLPDKDKNDDKVEKCLGWFGEHRYGVTLAAEWLKEHTFLDLEYEMAEADPEVRVPKMISLSLKDVREGEPPAGEYAYQLLERLAVFVEPVDENVARIGLDPTHQPHFNETISLLKREKLLFEVRLFNDRICYVVHPSAREYIFYHEHHSSPADLPSFALSGFTSAAATVYPGDSQSPGKKTVVGLLESLKRETSRPGCDTDQQIELCRAAFGVVRSRMVATTVSRWSRYDEYLRFLVEVIDSARRLSKIGPALYEDELAWLYNEAGLAYYGEGSMLDAIAVWEQSYEINRGLDQGGDGHHIFQSLCNLGGAYIQFGKLQRAESYLYKARAMGLKLQDADHVARIDVYLALLCHLRGNIGEANKRYDKVIQDIQKLNEDELGNMRAYSIALRHYADLLLKQDGTRSKAWEMIQTSKAIAETNSYQDLVAYARLSYGHLHRVRRKFPEAIREYRVALDLARKMGLRRLEAEAQSELARVDLDLGDSQVARRRAMKALQIANEHLLGLRQTHCLVILGRATIDAGERELGIHYLRHAKRLADAQEYRLRGNEAEATLYEIGEPVENSEVEASSAA